GDDPAGLLKVHTPQHDGGCAERHQFSSLCRAMKWIHPRSSITWMSAGRKVKADNNVMPTPMVASRPMEYKPGWLVNSKPMKPNMVVNDPIEICWPVLFSTFHMLLGPSSRYRA